MGQALTTAHYLVFNLLRDQLFGKLTVTKADLTGRTYLVTGANSGLGLAVSVHLAQTQEKGEAAKREIIAQTGFSGDIQIWDLDMEAFSSVVQFAERAKTSLDRLDGAIMNAGVISKEWDLTTDGWERTLQVNSPSTGLLGVLLLPILQATSRLAVPNPNASPQVLPHLTFVGSGAQFRARFTARNSPNILQTLNTDTPIIKKDRYETSKLYSLFLARAVSRLPKRKDDVHPGLVVTGIGRAFNFGSFVTAVWNLLGWTPAEGALNLLYGVLSPTPPGAYVRVCQVSEPPAWVKTTTGEEIQKRRGTSLSKFGGRFLQRWTALSTFRVAMSF
ncbi:hypothetical protein FB45DRAFT_921826 [Roridomyces roridus]|uniref:NAD(P)-binding protein n=1 Tax=Roridomyces roridus TaxID=1738132 RepID=A0AAD7BMS4_9AGAR|nr:hypothetical protein FB45DRAFT_921826 [Roridomyces roridus]